jgi:hypothetical protein
MFSGYQSRVFDAQHEQHGHARQRLHCRRGECFPPHRRPRTPPRHSSTSTAFLRLHRIFSTWHYVTCMYMHVGAFLTHQYVHTYSHVDMPHAHTQVQMFRCGLEIDCDGVIAPPPPNATTPPPITAPSPPFPLEQVITITGVIVGTSIAVGLCTMVAAFFLRYDRQCLCSLALVCPTTGARARHTHGVPECAPATSGQYWCNT